MMFQQSNCFNNYYGEFRTRTFSDIFETEEIFIDSMNETKIFSSPLFSSDLEKNLSLIYYLLYARYGNSHIASSDENQFVYNIASTIFMYAPTWSKRLEIQEKIRNLSESEVLAGSRAIHNHSYNPSTEPSTATLNELTTIDDQSTTNYIKNKLEGYNNLMQLLETDVTENFINKFKKLFIKIIVPDYPLFYTTREGNDE